MNALEKDGVVAKKSLSRSSVHRLLTAHKLNKVPSSFEAQEHRSFEAMYAGQLWQGDVMHGPRITANGRTRKSYLVSWMDDASRLVTHSEFRLSEQKEEIEYVLKQGLIKRGLPYKIYIDNGSAYRSKTLQEACARLQIQVIFCKAYSPESKGKIERWHGTLRGQFLSEIEDEVLSLTELNIRFWRWLEQYNNATHAALGMSPNERYQRDLNRIRTLGPFAKQLDELFLHRHKRKVRKDGTISYNSQYYEVPYHLVGDYVLAVVQPENNQVIAVETLEGEALSKVNVLDKISNNYRKRH
jgi:transposase InsO family protein